MVEVRQTEAFARWFRKLRDRQAWARIQVRIDRLVLGLPVYVRPVGEGVSELRVAYGPGYRVYFVRHGGVVIVLLAGGDKASQDRDIPVALELARSLYELAMPKIKTIPWDSADQLETADDIAVYLEAVFEDGDPALINHALGVVARAKGMTEIAQRTGMGRQSLYKALSVDGHPEFSTVLNVVRALGLKLTIAAP